MKIIKRLSARLFDFVFSCSYTEQSSTFIEEGSLWRETVFACRRCGKVESLAQNLIASDEFWESESPYCLSIDPRER
jgi:hypothetical protein